MRRVLRLYSSSIFLLVFAIAFTQVYGQAAAPKVTVHLDPQKTEIRWTLKTALHTVHGTFQLKGGAMTFDPTNGQAEGEILVDVTSGQSGDKSRDGKMQDEVLESRTYPQAFFHPVKVSNVWKAGPAQNVTIDGTFNIHGQDHPLTLQLRVQGTGADATAETHFVVPYVAWGMKNPGNFMIHVDKQVDIDVTAYGTVEGLPK